MTTPPPTRVALSEIPGRLEQLRVATTPTNLIADEPTPANVLNLTLPDNSEQNIPLTDIQSTPSPDEIIIRQRGRRRITLSWSPEKCSDISNHLLQKTPTKANISMTLRSSPRKRLILDISQNSTDKHNSPGRGDTNWKSPIISSKKLKLEEKPLARNNIHTPLHVMLKGLSNSQLIDMIKNLVKSEPQLEEKIRTNFPMPDISPMEEQLIHVKRNIYKSLPTSRIVKKTDSIAYSRAATHLTALKGLIMNQSRLLHDSKHWDALTDYVIMAWDYVRSTPVWDNHSQNAVRRQCFKTLSWHCAAALNASGTLLTEQKLTEIEAELKEMSKDSEELVSCIKKVNDLLGKIRSC